MSDFFRSLNNSKTPYIIAEIGSNHNGDIELAKKTIKAAKDCGCHCVKFQSWTPQSLIAREEYDRNTKYNDSPKKHFGSLREMVERYYLREEQHYELNEYCREIGIQFNSTPFSFQEVDLLEKLNVPFYKIASMDINNPELIKYIAAKGKPILLSTGMATMQEIDAAVSTIETQGNDQIVILHCISIYPPRYEDINLNNIKSFHNYYCYPVGFSDHSIGVSIPVAAVALGACVIEKHFTLDKDMEGWDHEISADPAEMSTLVKECSNVSIALGSERRVVSGEEEKKKIRFRRSIVSISDMKKDHVLRKEDLTSKRPGSGISPDELKYVVGRKLKRDINADELIRWEDLN